MKDNTTMSTGFFSLGFIANRRPTTKGENDLSTLSKIVGKKITDKDLDDLVDSTELKKEYFDAKGNAVADEEKSFSFRFLLPWKSKNGSSVYGRFSRKSKNRGFVGVKWEYDKQQTLYDLGYVNPQSRIQLNDMTGENITNDNAIAFSGVEYYNGAGYTRFPDGTIVEKGKAKYIKFSTPYLTKHGGLPIVGWFSKEGDNMNGISWGTEENFKERLQLGNKYHFSISRMKFKDIKAANSFLAQIETNSLPEIWTFADNKGQIDLPILKSYLECELDRLYYEKDEFGKNDSENYKDRIVYNNDRTRAMFNTNLIDKYGHDLIIEGDVIGHGNQEYLCNMIISPSRLDLSKRGYVNSSLTPKVPAFFRDENDIFFHSDWSIDNDMARNEHIIEERKERFPKQYRDMAPNILANHLDNSITLAQKIARRNYKFIVPMYYPAKHRIQLLMPIYLNGEYTRHPDFALVLTPHSNEKIYTPETILGLKEVYQDARLIAKPETSWLNPEIIGEEFAIIDDDQ